MDWPRDNAFLCEYGDDLKRFNYQSRPATVITIVESDKFIPQVYSLETENEWNSWLRKIDLIGSGLVLLLSNSEIGKITHKSSYEPTTIEDWLQREENLVKTPKLRRAETFAALGEKKSPSPLGGDEYKPRSVRSLPFSQATFRHVCYRFNVNRSIIRTLTRSDVPSFSCDSVDMGGPTFVYNCRTSNSWPSDLGFSATYFPQKGLNFAIFYGTSSIIEKNIITRLQSTREEAAYPLLLPGLLAELELDRHTRLVESNINIVEAKIFELNFQSGNNTRRYDRSDVERRNQAKREAWLNLSYLRNSIETWSAQLQKMTEHAQFLSEQVFKSPPREIPCLQNPKGAVLVDTPQQLEPQKQECGAKDNEEHRKSEKPRCSTTFEDRKEHLSVEKWESNCPNLHRISTAGLNTRMDYEIYIQQMQSISKRIQSRLTEMRDEYDEKIRDCTMRVDGMAMATQWAHSETAVEIALATNRDSKVMRSISLVTMVFLPGTFFATVFSMTFFDWFGNDNGKTRVSSYLWIYVVITVFFTAITIGLWYFFVIFRRSGRKVEDSESIIVD